MIVERGTDPVRWFVVDGWCEPSALWRVPPADAPGWVRYDNDCERGKRARRDLPPWAAGVLGRLQGAETLRLCRDVFGLDAAPDPTLHGGGLHVTAPGGYLGTHLDYDRHPHVAGKRRAVNLIAFCHPAWEPGWGGEFYLADPAGSAVRSFEPRPGRLLAVETTDLSYHGVLPVAGPAERVSVAAYLLAEAGPSNTRTRALFMPRRG